MACIVVAGVLKEDVGDGVFSVIRSGVELNRLFPVLVEPGKGLLEDLVAILGRNSLDRVAPGGRLAEEVFQRGDLPLELGDLALEVSRLAVGELPLPFLRLPGAIPGPGRGCGDRGESRRLGA